MYLEKKDMLNKFHKINGEILYKNSFQRDGELSTEFYKFTNKNLIGPFFNPCFYTIDEVQYNKALDLIDKNDSNGLSKDDLGVMNLVRMGLRPGMPYIISNNTDYIMLDKILKSDSKNVPVRKWEDLNDFDLEYWCDKLDYLELAETQKQ